MTVETHLHRARKRAESERAAVTAKRDALDAFARRVREQSPSGSRAEAGASATGGVTAASAVTRGTDGIERVRSAFAATVVEHTEPESVLASLRQELGDQAALALAPTTNAAFMAQFKRELCSRTVARRRELDAARTALGSDHESLSTHAEPVDEFVSWLSSADETPLSELGFDELRARHDELARFRAACEAASDERQAWLDGTTSEQGQVAVVHRRLVESVYEDFTVEYPGLATLTRLLDVCDDAQRAVRAHLVRRA